MNDIIYNSIICECGKINIAENDVNYIEIDNDFREIVVGCKALCTCGRQYTWEACYKLDELKDIVSEKVYFINQISQFLTKFQIYGII